jgi:octaprenyl-diphosphate synthase
MNAIVDTTSDLGVWLSKELCVVSGIMSSHLDNKHREINNVCGELAAYKGKLLRPSLLLLSWRSVSGSSEPPLSVLRAAAVVELIHLATLVHDDVLDEADLRRGKRTLNSLRGNEAAVMLGDYLLSSAFHLCSTIKSVELNLLLGEVTNTLCAGEFVQLFHRNDVDLDIDSYYQIIRDKTASLIAASCEMGAMLGCGSAGAVEALKNFGGLVGTAFQINDDLLDLLAKRKDIGKPAGRDLEKGKLTLPVIVMLSSNPSLKAGVQDAMLNNDKSTLHSLLESKGAIAAAVNEVGRLVDAAILGVSGKITNESSEQLCKLAEQLKRPF